MKLNELVLYSQNITNQLIESGGELTPAIEYELANIEKDLAVKTDKYVYVMERLDLEAKYWKDKAALYAKVSQSCANVKENLKSRIKEAMQALDKTELEGLDFRFKLVNQGKALDINENKIPLKYKIEEVVYKLDRKQLKEDLEKGEQVEGCTLRPVVSLRVYPKKGI